VGAACWLVRRSTFLSFGGFDEAFQNGYEDVDLCVRLRLAGYRLLVSHQSRIHHWVGSSPTRALRDRGNRELFLRRWSGITSTWGRREWPIEYLRCYVGRWWRASARKLLLAVWLLVHDRRSSDKTNGIRDPRSAKGASGRISGNCA
jgi:GT2 family glycosyltransferase